MWFQKNIIYKVFKKYNLFLESNKKYPKIGDWVILEFDIIDAYSDYDKDFVNFISSNVGYIWDRYDDSSFFVKYFNVPKHIKDNFEYFDFDDEENGESILINVDSTSSYIKVKYFSNNKNDIDRHLNSIKYNI